MNASTDNYIICLELVEQPGLCGMELFLFIYRIVNALEHNTKLTVVQPSKVGLKVRPSLQV